MNIDYLTAQVDKLKLKTIRVAFPLHRDALSAYFSPILGQYAIKNTDFIQEFIISFHKATSERFKGLLNVENLETGGSLYTEELFVPVILNIYKGGKFTLKVNTPALGFLYSIGFKKRRRFYRRLLNLEYQVLRNYKKLLQVISLKILDNYSPLTLKSPLFTTLLNEYKDIRNAYHQRS